MHWGNKIDKRARDGDGLKIVNRDSKWRNAHMHLL